MDWSPLIISLKTSIAAAVITFFLGIFAANFVFQLRGKLSKIFDVVFTLPLVLPPTVLGFILLILLGKNGMMGKILMNLGIRVVFTWSATVIASVVVSFPLMYRSAKAAFEQVDRNLIYAGRTLGLSERKIFWKIIMPSAWPGVLSGAILSFSRSIGEFGATLMIAGNIPGTTQTMPMSVYMEMQSGNGERAAVWVWVMIGISFFIILFLNLYKFRVRKPDQE